MYRKLEKPFKKSKKCIENFKKPFKKYKKCFFLRKLTKMSNLICCFSEFLKFFFVSG